VEEHEMSAATIPECHADDDRGAMFEALDAAGCLVIRDAASSETMSAIRSELQVHMTAAKVHPDSSGDFYPGLTRRITALMGRSPTARDLAMDETIGSLCDRHLLPNCADYQLHVTAALEVGPGARDQVLHREEDPFRFFELPRPNLILATMWAVNEFTTANGGTQVVPGSHRWGRERTAEPHEVVRAEMSAGSVLVWLGGTLHGAGANVTEGDWRYGVILTYSLGWLRQEENQAFSMPLSDALELPDSTRRLLGFAMDYNGALGFYDPRVLL
jgi:ectoine hydroxylase-related dioxygenase (phytanoyl-CoA dioxygenase family)